MRRAVIKQGDVARGGIAGPRLNLCDIGREADGLVLSARAEAARLVAEARRAAAAEMQRAADARRAAAEAGRAEGYEAGRSEGHAAGLAEARERFAADSGELVSALRGMLEEARARRELIYSEASRDVLVLAIAIGRRVVARLAEVDPALAVESATRALDAARQARRVVLRVNPADVALVRRYVEQDFSPTHDQTAVQVVEDEAVGRGGAVLESTNGSVDAQLSTQVERIADELLKHWRQGERELLQGDVRRDAGRYQPPEPPAASSGEGS